MTFELKLNQTHKYCYVYTCHLHDCIYVLYCTTMVFGVFELIIYTSKFSLRRKCVPSLSSNKGRPKTNVDFPTFELLRMKDPIRTCHALKLRNVYKTF